jgi:hypothetical protein
MSVPPAGTTPASAFEVIGHAVQEPPPAILADKIDPLSGEYESLLEGRGLADAFAIEALRIQRATGAAAREVGNRFRELTHVDDDSAEKLESMTREAFAPGEEAGVLQLETVSAEPDESDPSQLNALIEYRDLLAPADTAKRRLVFPL